MTKDLVIGFNMKPTIIVKGKYGDITIFDSIAKAQAYLEPIDIRNDEYTIFDASGKRLKAKVIKDLRGIEMVTLSGSEGGQSTEVPELKVILIGLLSRSGFPANAVNTMELNQLLKESLKFKVE